MTRLEDGPPNPGGEALVRQLLWVHGMIRGDLERISTLANRIGGGAPAAEVQAEVAELAAGSPVWTLRVNCLRYCRLVHHHHSLEDAAVFPGLRRVNPALCPVIDKLEADHVLVARYLDEVEAAARSIGKVEAARTDLVDALNGLAEHLLAHLEYEEANISPTLRRLSEWPQG